MSHCSHARTLSSSRWNVAVVLQSPNGITFHSNSPFLVQNATAFWALEVISTCQYPDIRSSMLKNLAVNKMSWILGRGYASLIARSFKAL